VNKSTIETKESDAIFL